MGSFGGVDICGGADVTGNGIVYVPVRPNLLLRLNVKGSVIGSWPMPDNITHVAVAPAGGFYGLGYWDPLVYHFNAVGSLIGSWTVEGVAGSTTVGIDVSPDDGTVFVTRFYNPAFVKYYTAAGSFLGSFPYPAAYALDIALSNDGRRAYVAAGGWIRYYDRVVTTVVPASLGKVKALFR